MTRGGDGIGQESIEPRTDARSQHDAGDALAAEIARRDRVERRMERLLAVSERYGAAASLDDIARITLDDGVVAIGASSASLWRAVDDRLVLLGATAGHVWPGVGREITVDGETALAAAVRARRPIFVGSASEYREQFPASAARLATAVPPHFALALLPLVGERETSGAIVLSYDRERAFEPADRAFKEILARQCSLALERVASLALADQQRRELELLHALTVRANQTDNVDDVLELALVTVERGARCERSGVLVFDADGTMRWRRARGLSEAYRVAAEGRSPWSRDARDPQPIAIADARLDPAWASLRDLFVGERIAALAFVPIVHHGELLGAFTLYRGEPSAFAPRELRFVAQVAVQVGHALVRRRAARDLERAFREERGAHHAAELAKRAREDVLSIVSHDLRDPLNAVMLGAASLLDDDGLDPRVRDVAGRIRRQADRMARQIDDLLDFTRIDAGRLELRRAAHEPVEILAATSEVFLPIARQHGVSLDTHAHDDLPAVVCDCERAVQVMSNLVANAIKVTPRGGRIAIGVERSDRRGVVFYVRDTGPGIEPDELPDLFERYRRGKQPRYKGSGLGLSIARGIVDAHGGRIWADSRIGAGSTFYFSLS
jgi:signal transduction histidine kinase